MNRKSWHWRLASFYGPIYDTGSESQTFDVCRYSSAVVRGMFLALIVMAACVVVSALIGNVVGWVAAMIMMGGWLTPTHETSIITSAFASAAIVSGLMFSILKLQDWMYTRNTVHVDVIPEHKTPGFIALWYRSIKDRFCFNITIR